MITLFQQAQANHEHAISGQTAALQYPSQPPQYSEHPSAALYPALTEYMGMQLTPQVMQSMQVVPSQVRTSCTLFVLKSYNYLLNFCAMYSFCFIFYNTAMFQTCCKNCSEIR